MSEPQRIVIVGAGPAGLATAFALTDQPGWSERYTVDVHQMGWRVGGKCATGRNPDAHERIQEHGIHVFGNMYYNTLHMVQTVFAEWNAAHPDEPPLVMEDEFLPSVTTWNTEYFDGAWHRQVGYFPKSDGAPWTDPDGKADTAQIIQGALFMVNQALAHMLEGRRRPGESWWLRLTAGVERRLGRTFRGWALRVGRRLDREMNEPHPPSHMEHDDVVRLLDGLRTFLRRRVERRPDHVERRLTFIQIDLVLTVVRGMLVDEIFADDRDIDDLDDVNYRDWLRDHGLSEITLRAGLPQGYPNTALSYAFGDTTAVPTMSAAAWLTFFLRQLDGVGSGAYFFRRGTGETVMKPLFEVLRQRGVRFYFFHRLVEVEAAAGEDTVSALQFDVQATPRSGIYEPLRRAANGHLVWPDRPDFDQLVEGEALRDQQIDLESWWSPWQPVGRLRLERGVDFDHVVLATPIATLPHTCAQILDHPTAGPRWQAMVDHIQTAATQAVQIWTSKPVTELGWPRHGTTQPTDRFVGGFYGQDLTSSCDFSDLIAEESWPDGGEPQGLIYFIGALPDPEVPVPFDDHTYPERVRERVRWSSVQFLRNIDGLLPGAVSTTNTTDGRSFDFDLLVQHDGVERRGVNRFDTQYWRANIEPNERYTLTVAGSARHRLECWNSGLSNLTLAGDWTYTGFNVGSFEGSVMSGKLASLTLTGAPTLARIWGYTYLHPRRQGPPPPRIP